MPKMGNMIEIVAKAIHKELYGSDVMWKESIPAAKAALEALRTPDADVEWAVARSAWHMGSGRSGAQIINDMIDECLS